jgi:N6-L-threonylcarbamoyladenine synthase
MDFSFSGIKTAVINLNHKNPNINKADLCASFEKTVTEILIENIKKSINYIKNTVEKDCSQNNPIKLVLAGGVSANSYIRNAFMDLEKEGIQIYMPDLKLCTDNAAMIASAGYYNYLEGNLSDYTLNAVPNLKL